MNKIKTIDIELTIKRHYNARQNIIVPNVSWGLGFKYELDMLILSPSRYATEIEIKISKSDIKKDLQKSIHAHNSNRIKYFYFAVPDYLKDCEYIPVDAGLISVYEVKYRGKINYPYYKCKVIRPARINKIARKFNDSEYLKLLKLGYHRLWTLKEALYNNYRNK